MVSVVGDQVTVIGLQGVRDSLIGRVASRVKRILAPTEDWYAGDQGTARGLLRLIGSKDVAIVTLDNSITLIRELRECGFRAPIVLVQHGANHFSYGQDVNKVIENTVLLSWGERECESYSLRGLRPSDIVAVGSILNQQYLDSAHGDLSAEIVADICLVSEFRLDQEDQSDDYMRSRTASWELLLKLVQEASHRIPLKIAVALRPTIFGGGDAPDKQLAYFRDRLGPAIVFSDPRTPFASYHLIDQADITLGLQSALLVESVARGRKVLFCNPLGDDRMTSPVAGVCAFSGNDLTRFIERLQELKTLSTPEYRARLEKSPDYLVATQISPTVALRRACAMLKSGSSASQIASSLARQKRLPMP